MKLRIVLMAGGIGLAGCGVKDVAAQSPGVEGGAAAVAEVPATPDGHTSRISLDWAGLYEGVLPEAGAAGVVTRLTLNIDHTFVLESLVVRADSEWVAAHGTFRWLPDGNTVELDGAGAGRRFAVGEGRLVEWPSDGSPPAPGTPGGSLHRVPASPEASQATTVGHLQNHHWRLESAFTGVNERIDALFPPAAPFEFHFYESSLEVKGGCNGFRGRYQMSDDGQLLVAPMASTLMACPPALMEADRAIEALLAQPMRAMLVRGAAPALILVSAENDVLRLAGSLTPEAQYGPPTLVFLEVAAETVPCPDPDRAAPCLNVRELRFDDQGIRVGEPGVWQSFRGSIQGFEHTPGVRQVLRVKRFQPHLEKPPVHVLDMVVESESVPRAQ